MPGHGYGPVAHGPRQQRISGMWELGNAMNEPVGISGFAVYVPPYRIDLEAWCAWTNNPWDKTKAVAGPRIRKLWPTTARVLSQTLLVQRHHDSRSTRYGGT